MIVVKPTSGQTKIKVTGLYQWDKFQTLQFADEYPFGTEVHFAIKDETVALVYLLENGSVRIPSVLLESALPIMAWVHVGETTVLEIEMPVTSRAKPSDYISIEDDVQHSIEYRTVQLEQWQVEAIKQMSDRYTKAETDKKLNLKADVNTVEDGLTDRYTKAETDKKLNLKADVNTVEDGLTDRYTKAETDSLLAEKASVEDVALKADKTYVDNKLSEKGEQGEQGIQGEQGPKGDKGDTGETGIQGIQGEQGERGPKGDRGNDGYTPIKGVDYFDGIDGKDGEKGPKGDTGNDGYTPIKDIDYFDGADGKDGERGIQGEKGEQGERGEQGEQGPKGDKGEQGVAGSVPIEVVTQAEYDNLTPVDDTFYYIKEV